MALLLNKMDFNVKRAACNVSFSKKSLMKSICILRFLPCLLTLLALLPWLPLTVRAQQTLTLEACLTMARENNVRLRQARYEAATSAIVQRQNRADYLPRISASTGANQIYGTVTDPNTFQRVQRTTTTSYPNLNAQVVLFNGFAKYFALRQAGDLAEAGRHNVAQTEIEVEASVTRYYLQVIVDEENIRISKERIELLTGQLAKMEKLAQAGMRTEEDVFRIKSQLASEKLVLLNQENRYRQDLLLLLQEIEADPSQAYTLAAPDLAVVPADPQPEPVEAVLQTALAVSPGLKAAHLQISAARHALQLSRSSLLPRLTLGGSVGSVYSSNFLFDDPETKLPRTVAFRDQLKDNLYQTVGLNLSIPIFGAFANRYQNQIARLTIRNAELNHRSTENRLRQTIHQAYQDVLTAREKYESVQADLASLQKSFEFAKRRYDSGSVDFYVYMETLNNKNNGEIALLQSQYEYYFTSKILELYRQP
jgi:outer membrane protein